MISSERKTAREENPFEMVKLLNGNDDNETKEVIIHVDFRLRQMHISTSFFIIIAYNTQTTRSQLSFPPRVKQTLENS